jgi:hypothetical protein
MLTSEVFRSGGLIGDRWLGYHHLWASSLWGRFFVVGYSVASLRIETAPGFFWKGGPLEAGISKTALLEAALLQAAPLSCKRPC